MCGIAGILAPRGEAASEQRVRAMTLKLAHRGPDALTTWQSEEAACALGHTRLAVIDLESGDQPMATADGVYTIVFNGEIYNFRELRRELEARGRAFRTRSDTEVLLQGWAEWGEAVLPRLEGMFAFAIWDERRRRLTLARDRAGQKPLHLLRSGRGLLFASEAGAFEALGVPLDIDPDAMASYLALGYVPAPHTMWRDVSVLPPAHLLVCTPDGVGAPRRWWRFDPHPRPTSPTAAARRVRALLEAAVERRRVCDVPLGALLSGGVDSTAVTALLQRGSEAPIHTFSIGFDDPVYDEGAWARRAAAHLGTRHTHRVVTAPAPEVVDELARCYDLPFADASALPLRIVSGVAGESVTVALTGDGGDEIFAGYWRMHAVGSTEPIPAGLARAASALAAYLPGADFRSPARRAERLLRGAAFPAAERLAEWTGVFGARGAGLLRDDVRPRVREGGYLDAFRAAWCIDPAAAPLVRAVRTTFETYLPEDLLVKADRASMANSLELRSPFLDTALVEYCATLPPGIQRRGGALKAVLKEAVSDLVPPEILMRPKRGFGVPLPGWLRGPWRGFVNERLKDPTGPLSAWLDPTRVARVVEDHLERGIDREHQVWALLILDAWLRKGRA
ncbi:MAG: asparagine synthase (glutamine-hydrolyzing) [Longimicrobiales bacterium]|nr:asparagine synthase (glutamine-hydrolyzing) [Longimicrobiales bacterium]